MNDTSPADDELIQKAETHFNAHEYDKVIECATQAIVLDCPLPDAYYWRGRAYGRTDKEEEARKDADALLACTPVTARHFAYRGWAYCVKEEYPQAVTKCTEALSREPLLKEAYFFRGWAYNDWGKYDLAIEDYSKAIKLDSKYANAYCNRGGAYYNKDEYDLAIEDYDKAIELDSKYAAAYCNRGRAYWFKDNYKDAMTDYAKALELEPRCWSILEDFILDIILNKQDKELASFMKETPLVTGVLKKSDHYWARLIGDILCDIEKKDDYMKYIKFIEVVYKLQIDEEAKKKLPREGCYFYQYMTSDVLKSMNKSEVLWLTPACYQNDPDEGKYLFEYLQSHEEVSDALKVLMCESETDKSLNGTIAFIRALNAGKDDLQMWNSSYGNNGKGVALGVHPSKFDQATSFNMVREDKPQIKGREGFGENKTDTDREKTECVPMTDLFFARVLYLTTDPKKAEDCKDDIDTFKGVITALAPFTNEFLSSPQQREDVKKFLPRIFMPISHLVKSADYKHEKEWRLLYLTTIKGGKDTGRINWKPLPLLHIETEPIVLNGKGEKEEVWLGPRIVDSELEKLRIGHWLEHELGDVANIYLSRVHFRDTGAQQSPDDTAPTTAKAFIEQWEKKEEEKV